MTPEETRSRREAYQGILGYGLLAIRAAAYQQRPELCEIEAEHLHNIPSLLDEINERRHIYYIMAERPCYLERVREHADRNYLSGTVERYKEPWALLMKFATLAQEAINQELEQQAGQLPPEDTPSDGVST